MSLKSVSVQRDGEIRVVVGADVFHVTAAERTRGEVRDSDTLRTRLEASRSKPLPVPIHLYTDSAGNQYVITGDMLTHNLPDPSRDPERSR